MVVEIYGSVKRFNRWHFHLLGTRGLYDLPTEGSYKVRNNPLPEEHANPKYRWWQRTNLHQ